MCHRNFETQYYNELLEQLEEISQHLNSSCSYIFNSTSSDLSGYYTIQASNGSLISVYCDMEGQCDGKGGWTRTLSDSSSFFFVGYFRKAVSSRPSLLVHFK